MGWQVGYYWQDDHVMCRQTGYPIATTGVAACPPGGPANYPIATICRMPTWCAGSRLATLLPLFAGCPRGVPAAGWLPYCHYLQDAHVVCRRQAGYPFATICRMLTWWAVKLAILLPLFAGCPPTWCAVKLAIPLPLFAGCPSGVPATGWLPYCHYLQDAHVLCRQQAGYPIATI